MNEFLLILAVGICVAQIRWAFRRPNGIVEFPFLIGWVYLGWLLPQAVGIINASTYRDLPTEKLLLMICISAACGFIGYAARNTWSPASPREYDDTRLAASSLAMVVFGAYFFWRLTQLPAELLEKTQWSGAPVMYLFLSSPLIFGFFIAFAVFLRTKSTASLVPMLLASPLFVHSIILAGRRGRSIELALGVCALLWFKRRWRPNKWLALCGIPLAIIAVNGIGIYRSTVYSNASYGDVRTVLDAPLARVSSGVKALFSRADELLFSDDYFEVMNATQVIKSCDARARYDLGVSLWNSLVFRFVPAQLVGRAFKYSLFVPISPTLDPRSNYRAQPGTTFTGLADSYASFWFFGGMNFFLIGLACRWLWENASRGDFAYQLAYAVMIRHSLEALTHSTHSFLLGGVEFMIFAAPALLWARRRTSRLQ